GGNGARAAVAAGYTAARADQAAYQVLHRQHVQQHIRERIRESRVSADEIIGTLASHMRGDLTEFFDESGNFSIEIAKKKGIGHLIKSISGTISDIPSEPSNAASSERSNVQAFQRSNAPCPGTISDIPSEPSNAASSERSNVQTCQRSNAPCPGTISDIP